jgi:hypothetical protein
MPVAPKRSSAREPKRWATRPSSGSAATRETNAAAVSAVNAP